VTSSSPSASSSSSINQQADTASTILNYLIMLFQQKFNEDAIKNYLQREHEDDDEFSFFFFRF
jgi:hypothetical protein